MTGKLNKITWRNGILLFAVSLLALPLLITACGGDEPTTDPEPTPTDPDTTPPTTTPDPDPAPSITTPQATACPSNFVQAQSHGDHASTRTNISNPILPTLTVALEGAPAFQLDQDDGIGGTLTVAIPDDVTTNNPWDIIGPGSTAYNFAAYLNRYTTPLKLSAQKYQWIPNAAADYPTDLEREGDYWVSTITFRDDIVWSDGEKLDAEDVAFTVNTVLEFELTGNWADNINDSFVDRAEVVPGSNAVKYYLRATDEDGDPQIPGLAVWQEGVTQAAILAEHFWAPQIEALETCGADDDACLQTRREALYGLSADEEPVVGPSAFVEWQAGSFVALERNSSTYLTDSEVTQYADGTVEETVGGETNRWLEGTDDGSATEVDLEITRPIDPDTTIFSVFNSQDAAVLALRDGEVDYFLSPLGLSAGLRAQVASAPGVTTFENPSNGFRYLAFNFDREPFNDCALRQAVALLIDRDLIATSILQGAVSSIYTAVPEGNGYWHNSAVPQIGRDADGSSLSREERINQVVELLTEAGYTWESEPSWDADNRRVVAGTGLLKPDGTPITERQRLLQDGTAETIDEPFELLSPGNGYDPLRATAALVIAQSLNEAGITTEANLTGFNEIVDKVFSGATEEGVALRNFDMWILGWGLTPYPDYLLSFFTEDNAGPEGFNAGGFINAEYEAAASQFEQATEVEAARELAFQMQAILATELPYVTLFSTPIIEAYRTDSLDFSYTDVLDGVQNLFQSIDGPLSDALVTSE